MIPKQNSKELRPSDLVFLKQVCDKPYHELSPEDKQYYQMCMACISTRRSYLYYIVEHKLFMKQDSPMLKKLLLNTIIELKEINTTLQILNIADVRQRLDISTDEHKNFVHQICHKPDKVLSDLITLSALEYNYSFFTDEQIIAMCLRSRTIAKNICIYKKVPIVLKKHILDVISVNSYAEIFVGLYPYEDEEKLREYIFNLMLKNYTCEYITAALHLFYGYLSPLQLKQLYTKFHYEIFKKPTKNIALYTMFRNFLSFDEKKQLLDVIFSDGISLSADTIDFIIHSINWKGIDITRLRAIHSLLELKDDPYPFLH